MISYMKSEALNSPQFPLRRVCMTIVVAAEYSISLLHLFACIQLSCHHVGKSKFIPLYLLFQDVGAPFAMQEMKQSFVERMVESYELGFLTKS